MGCRRARIWGGRIIAGLVRLPSLASSSHPLSVLIAVVGVDRLNLLLWLPAFPIPVRVPATASPDWEVFVFGDYCLGRDPHHDAGMCFLWWDRNESVLSRSARGHG